MGKEIQMTSVFSSQIAAIGHDGDKTLAVRFNNGAMWYYYPVADSLYNELGNALSIGKFFNANITKNSNINATRA